MQVRNNPSKWARNSAGASADYASGAQNPRRSWAESTQASEGNYEAGVQEAIGRKAFSKGVQDAGDSKWKAGIQEKGRARYSQGVAVAQDEYQKGFAPYVSTLNSLTLPPRGPKGQNYQRSQLVGEAMRETKLSQ